MPDDFSALLLDDSEWPQSSQPAAPISRPTPLQAERALIGAVLNTPELFDAAKQLTSADFSHRLRGDIWDSLRWLRAKGRQIDPVLVAKKLEAYGLAVPKPHTHWHAALGALLDDGTAICGDPDLARAYAAVILEAAAERRRSGQKLPDREVA